MNAIALVIGNGNYSSRKNQLPNAVKDAMDVSRKLVSLGFVVETKTDCTQEEFAHALDGFMTQLSDYHVALFYFAGHGLQIKGTNYLTAIDTYFKSLYTAKDSSISLDEILDRMQENKSSDNAMNILILDACRNDPYISASRNGGIGGLAPVLAPKGTIIGYSTSPGQTADDGRPGTNSIYASAFLSHIDDENIPIEEFFKRVRTTVYSLSNGEQISWEHTSLIGDFEFNSKELTHTRNMPYGTTAIADRVFTPDGSELSDVIERMRIRDFQTQANALREFKSMENIGENDKDLLFLIGRNILQTAEAGVYVAEKFIDSLDDHLSRMFTGTHNHVLNGLLFEMYFNKDGRFRLNKFKSSFLNQLYSLESIEKYRNSFDIIKNQLIPFRKHIFYLPGNLSVPIEVLTEPHEYKTPSGKTKILAVVRSIFYQGNEIFSIGQEESDYSPLNLSKEELIIKISKDLMIPTSKLRINFDSGYDDQRIEVPYEMHWFPQ